MNINRKIEAAIVIAPLWAIQATSWHWPLTRLFLSLVAVTLLFLTFFLGARLALKGRNDGASQPARSYSDFIPVLGTALGALVLFLLLAVIATFAGRTNPHRPSAAQGPEAQTGVDPASQAAAEFMGQLLGASAEQQRRQQADPRYQRFKQSLENASVCPRCGGAGVYRYVDGRGVLQSRQCPSCYGSGSAY